MRPPPDSSSPWRTLGAWRESPTEEALVRSMATALQGSCQIAIAAYARRLDGHHRARRHHVPQHLIAVLRDFLINQHPLYITNKLFFVRF